MVRTPYAKALLFLFCTLCAHAGIARGAGGTASDAPLRRKVLIIGIDGMRPDVLFSANAPNLQALIRGGAYASDAAADNLAPGGPGWTSVLTGIWHGRHAASGSGPGSGAAGDGPLDPAFFARIEQTRPDLRTAGVVNWEQGLDRLLSGIDMASTPGSDDSVASRAASLLMRGDPDVLFLHFGEPGVAGARFGFSRFSPPYRYAVARADERVGRVLEALQARPALYGEEWLILCTTDHGSGKRRYGQETPASRNAFLLVSGNGSARGTTIAGASLVDLAPTVMAFLGLTVDPLWGWEGRPVGLEAPIEAMQAKQAPAQVPGALPVPGGG
jgi:predicted AlkP superfamily pyrophosphatase or phosphodiesterase